MSRIVLRTEINAPIERCFDIARSIEFHQLSAEKTQEKAIAGRTSGLTGLNETVTWRAKHFGVWQELTSKIIDFHYPTTFTDEMVKGIFKKLHHVHRFTAHPGKTIMTDEFDFKAPLGFLGKIAEVIFLKNYLKNFISERNQLIKACAESDGWKKILNRSANGNV